MAEPHTDSITTPSGQVIVIHPISYKLARQFREHIVELVGRLTDGTKEVPFDDLISDMLDACCKPRLQDIEDLPLYTAAEVYSRWVALNFTSEKYSFTVALLEQIIEKLVGRKVSLKQIWSNSALLMATLAPTSTTANAAGPIVDGPSPSLMSDLPLPPGSLIGRVPPG